MSYGGVTAYGRAARAGSFDLATATAAKSGSSVTANVNGTVTAVQVARDLTVASGDVLIVNKIGSLWFAVGRAYTAAPAAVENDTVPEPKPSTVAGTLVVPPVETRSRRSSAWRDDDYIVQGQYGTGGNHAGVAFYGTKPRSLEGATVVGASISVRRPNRGGSYPPVATTMWLVTQSVRPVGAPTLTSSTPGPDLARNTSASFTVPTAWAQSIVDGTAGGLALYDADGSPYVLLSGRSDWSPAFTMRIDWTRLT